MRLRARRGRRQDDRIAAAVRELLLPQPQAHANELTPPVSARGVRVAWLLKFGEAINPDFYSGSDLTTKDVVRRFVIPLTDSERLPLYAYVPEEFRGRPRHFLSHAWDDYFRRPFGFGLVSILNYRFQPDDCVWIDFVCHNQHEVEQLPEHLRTTVESIGSVQFMINEAILFTRSWCIFELLQGYLSKSAMGLHIGGGHPADHLFKLDEAIEQFTSIREAQASVEADKRAIDQQVIDAFGQVEDADEVVRNLLSAHQRDLRRMYASHHD
jgi:hypothetical protein